MGICHNKRYENEFVKMMIKQGHHCERIAGSGSGTNAVCDAILFKEGQVYLVEVKATREPKFYLRAQIKEQLERMKRMAEQSGVKAMLAIKYKHRGWDIQELLEEEIH